MTNLLHERKEHQRGVNVLSSRYWSVIGLRNYICELKIELL